jgi:starch phosphorylase
MLKPDQARIRTFRVVPALPEPLHPLLELARNFWWTWRPEAADLFAQLDRDLWRQTGHNPVALLGRVSQQTLEQAATDRTYLHSLGQAIEGLRGHLERQAWKPVQPGDDSMLVAYFCAEFGLAECLQIYSGGLGILAGDHLKSASELGVPLVGVGLLYRSGYFHQYLNADGWQQETYPDLDLANQPIRREIDDETGDQVKVRVRLPGRDVAIGLWRADVGRISLVLLDTNLPDNSPEDRDITKTLYGGDVQTRIQQEMVLGIGGVRALRTLNLHPTVFHMNEGHSAFLALERIAELRAEHGLAFDEAREATAAQTIFTTHTPVPAGIDRFSQSMIEEYLCADVDRYGLDKEGLLALGRENVFDRNEMFSMAVLALRTSRRCNGVSLLHGKVSRSMWQNVWPGVPEEEIPITHVTNGVHTRTWLSPAMIGLFDRYMPGAWSADPTDHKVWARVVDIPDEELWRAHEDQRRRLVDWSRRRIRKQAKRRGATRKEADALAGALDPDALTIGFARRFATYKRATLLLRDMERLGALLDDRDRPVQILIAGKAHPADGPGKEAIRAIVKAAEQGGRFARIVFLEDYGIDVARMLVRGCDIWVNTPRRGMEASGTSGMKAAINGVVNVSVLDGWWDEAFAPDMGFAVGSGETYDDHDMQDEVESRALYDIIERHVIPEFFDRSADGVPHRWVHRVKRSIMSVGPAFNTNRMVGDYTAQLYEPAHRHGVRLAAGSCQEARGLAAQIARWRRCWDHVRIETVETPVGARVPVRTAVPVTAIVALGELTPGEVNVEAAHGAMSSAGDILSLRAEPLAHVEDLGDGRHRFEGRLTVERSGDHGFAVRVTPHDDRLAHPWLPGLIRWDSAASEPSARQRDKKAAASAT